MMRTMPLSWIVALAVFHTALTREISVTNGRHRGEWYSLDTCPTGTVAIGFDLLVEPQQGNEDNTALNGIRLYCDKPLAVKRSTRATISSQIGPWGKWSTISWCPSGFLISFSLKVEKASVITDDTGANNIMFQCSDHTILEGKGGPWGEYGNWSGVCSQGIDGIKTKVEDPEENEDDEDQTALNDVVFRCFEN